MKLKLLVAIGELKAGDIYDAEEAEGGRMIASRFALPADEEPAKAKKSK